MSIIAAIVFLAAVLAVLYSCGATVAYLVNRRVKRDAPSKTIDWQAIGMKLRDLREKCGLTTTQAAHQLGWSFPILVEIEEGRRGITSDELWQICTAYLRADPLPAEMAEAVYNTIWEMAREFLHQTPKRASALQSDNDLVWECPGRAAYHDLANEFGQEEAVIIEARYRQSIAARSVSSMKSPRAQ